MFHCKAGLKGKTFLERCQFRQNEEGGSEFSEPPSYLSANPDVNQPQAVIPLLFYFLLLFLAEFSQAFWDLNLLYRFSSF